MTTSIHVTGMSVDTDALQLSGRIARPCTDSRGLVLALHGGTYDSGYYDLGPDSLLELGAFLGYTVVALDRPGYGRTTDCDREFLSFSAQTQILAATVDKVADDLALTDRVVLVGHSIGGMLALRVASETTTALQGVEVSGMGSLWQPGLREMWASMISDAPDLVLPAQDHAHVMFGPADTYADAQVERNAQLLRPLPTPELVDAVQWSTALPSAAAKITVPVSLTLAEHDNIWQSSAEARAALAGQFTSAPTVRMDQFSHAGHSIELHHGARAYVLRQLAFVEECLVP
ncbi:alpha/beta hydrolase [Rhodococcus koreensis]|uniref:alpha/beta hydrolase n=1 Tax=Rhodococcus koreensis TaxID=99653 RepID=UPI003673175E